MAHQSQVILFALGEHKLKRKASRNLLVFSYLIFAADAVSLHHHNSGVVTTYSIHLSCISEEMRISTR